MPEPKTQMEIGIEVEREHKPTYEKIKAYLEEHGKLPPEEQVYEWISGNHIDEFETYYTALEKMEEELKKQSDLKLRLIQLADLLDDKGLLKEADMIDKILKKAWKFFDPQSSVLEEAKKETEALGKWATEGISYEEAGKRFKQEFDEDLESAR